jgi:hypothetical protein
MFLFYKSKLSCLFGRTMPISNTIPAITMIVAVATVEILLMKTRETIKKKHPMNMSLKFAISTYWKK